MLVVLDTNHFREVAEATTRAAQFRRRAEAERAEVFLSIITVQEAISGWLALINSSNAGRRAPQRVLTSTSERAILPP